MQYTCHVPQQPFFPYTTWLTQVCLHGYMYVRVEYVILHLVEDHSEHVLNQLLDVLCTQRLQYWSGMWCHDVATFRGIGNACRYATTRSSRNGYWASLWWSAVHLYWNRTMYISNIRMRMQNTLIQTKD